MKLTDVIAHVSVWYCSSVISSLKIAIIRFMYTMGFMLDTNIAAELYFIYIIVENLRRKYWKGLLE